MSGQAASESTVVAPGKCRRCKRQQAESFDQFEAEDTDLCAAHLPSRGSERFEAYGDCLHHKAHVLGIMLIRATSLLEGVSMSYLMSKEYQRGEAERIDAFLAGAELKEALK